jgi:glycosyltransferase involved in cell wall biosynthesis
MPLRIVIDVRQIRNFGIGTYIRNLVTALSHIDEENHYILAARPEDHAEFGDLGANFETLVFNRPESSRLYQFWFSTFIRDCKADLVHFPMAAVPWFAPKPYVVTIHDMSSFLFSGNTGWRENLRLYGFRRGLLQAKRVIAVSSATERDIHSLLGIPTSRIRQVYSAPDPRFYSDRNLPRSEREEEKRRIMERYQIDYPFLLYSGRIRPHKNLPRLIEAFAVVRGELENHPKYRNLKLIIIGDEISRHPGLRRAVTQTRVEQSVRFLGFIPFDTLRIFYSAAEAFVFPSLYEGFGLPPLEAMASGTPVVTSNLSSLPEAVGDAAVLVNPEAVFDISRGIREVLLDKDLRSRLIVAGQAHARKFSWDKTAKAVLDVYHEAAAHNV